jgi:uncharacterized protein HemX
VGSRSGEFGDGCGNGDADLERLRESVLDRPGDEVAGNDNSSNATSSGNTVNHYGLSTGQGLAIAALAAFALGVSVVNMVQSSQAQSAMQSRYEQAQADMRSRYEQSYRELATKIALNTNATDDMRASLIARGINPNNHDITDVGGTKP